MDRQIIYCQNALCYNLVPTYNDPVTGWRATRLSGGYCRKCKRNLDRCCNCGKPCKHREGEFHCDDCYWEQYCCSCSICEAKRVGEFKGRLLSKKEQQECFRKRQKISKQESYDRKKDRVQT